MTIVAMFIAVETEGYEMIHTLVSYSNASDLRRRLAMFACDVYIYKTALDPLGHQITNCTCLWSLIGETVRASNFYTITIILGNLAGELKRYPTTTAVFISMHECMLTMWLQQQERWLVVIEKLPVQKYVHSRHSEHADRSPVLILETAEGQNKAVWFHIHKKYMPLPNTCIIFPMLRYLHSIF